jgi:lactam utilization protein B
MNSANIACNPTEVFAEAVHVMNYGNVFADDGSSWKVACIHGDTSNSVETDQAITTNLKQSN